MTPERKAELRRLAEANTLGYIDAACNAIPELLDELEAAQHAASVFCNAHISDVNDDDVGVCPCCEAVRQSDRADSLAAQYEELRIDHTARVGDSQNAQDWKDRADSLAAQMVMLREALEVGDSPSPNYDGGAWQRNHDRVLADTEAAAKTWLEAHDREQRLAGARALFTRAEARLSLPTKASYYLDALTAELEAMEDEANGNEH